MIIDDVLVLPEGDAWPAAPNIYDLVMMFAGGVNVAIADATEDACAAADDVTTFGVFSADASSYYGAPVMLSPFLLNESNMDYFSD